MSESPRIGQAVVTDPLLGHASGYALIAASPLVAPADAEHLADAPQVTDFLHTAPSPGPYLSFYRLPSGCWALSRRFVHGQRRGTFHRVVVHTLVLPEPALAAVADDPWLLLARCRFEDLGGGAGRTLAELGDAVAAPDLEPASVGDLICRTPADPRAARLETLARRRDFLAQRLGVDRLRAALASALAALARGQRLLLAQDAEHEQLLAAAYSALPAADRRVVAWTTHLANDVAGLFRLAAAPDPARARTQLDPAQRWVLLAAEEASAGDESARAAAALASAVVDPGLFLPALYAGCRRHDLRLLEDGGARLAAWIAWSFDGERAAEEGYADPAALVAFLRRLPRERALPWCRPRRALAIAAATVARWAPERPLAERAAAVAAAVRETGHGDALLHPATLARLLADERDAGPDAAVQRAAAVALLLAEPARSRADWIGLGAAVAAAARALAAAGRDECALELGRSWWLGLDVSAQRWRAMPAELVEMLERLPHEDRIAVARRFAPGLERLAGDAGNRRLLAVLAATARAGGGALAARYAFAGDRETEADPVTVLARQAALGVDAKTLAARAAGLLPRAPAARLRAAVDLVLSHDLPPSARRALETRLVGETLRAPGRGWIRGLPAVPALLERPSLLERIAVRAGASWRRDEAAARAFLAALVRYRAFPAARALLEAANRVAPGFLVRWSRARPAPRATLAQLVRALDEPVHGFDLAAVAGTVRAAAARR